MKLNTSDLSIKTVSSQPKQSSSTGTEIATRVECSKIKRVEKESTTLLKAVIVTLASSEGIKEKAKVK